MNLFYLHRDPVEAARMQCDRHVVKMILETAQMLSTAHIELDGIQVAYKATHKNHPSTVWVRSSAAAYTVGINSPDGAWARVQEDVTARFTRPYAIT